MGDLSRWRPDGFSEFKQRILDELGYESKDIDDAIEATANIMLKAFREGNIPRD